MAGVTWFDFILVAWVLAFAIRGLARGARREVFFFVGLGVGLWVSIWVSQWVGGHWREARPAVVFIALRWLVAGLAGLAVISLSEWWGGLLGAEPGKGWLGWLDRLGGVVVGTVIGAALAVTAITALFTFDRPRPLTVPVAQARSTEPLIQGAAKSAHWAARWIPASIQVERRLTAAERRARRIRATTSPATP